jgi:2',3'-cyclic-nucleotide 2'-phosphodiesterase (5'-nucleotidase family)
MAEKKNNTSAPAGANTNKPAYTTVMLFSVNDIYAIDHFGRLAAFVKNKVKDLQPDAHYVTLNGDFLSPSLLSSIDKGKTKIDIMNQVGFDYVGVGNHEFDLSVSNMLQRIKQSKFKWINTNINTLEGTIPYEVTEVGPNKYKIGWLGFCTEKTKRLCINVPYDITIDPVAKVAQKHIEFMRNEKKADVLVALTHQDFPLDRNMAMHQDVDVILGGHDHVPFIEKNINKVGRDCWIVKVGCNCTHVGVTTIQIDNDDPKNISMNVEMFEITDPTMDTDPAVEELISTGKKILNFVKNKFLRKKPLSSLDTKKINTTFATYLMTKVRNFNHVDAVLVHGGVFKGKKAFPNGVTMVDLHHEIRWDELCPIDLPGHVIADAIKFSRSKGDFFGFLQFDDGIKLDAEGNVVKINNKPFEADKVYKTLWPLSMRDNTEPKATNDALLRYLNATIKKKKPHHEYPTVVECIIAALITEDWNEIFGNLTFNDLDKNRDGFIDQKEMLESLPDVSLSKAVFLVADTNRDGLIDPSEWRESEQRYGCTDGGLSHRVRSQSLI